MIVAILRISSFLGQEIPKRLKCDRHRYGFTLIELLLAIGLMGLIMGMAFPRFGTTRSSYFSAETDRGLANSVRQARISAIRGRTTVVLTVPSGNDNLLQERQLPRKEWPREVSDRLGVEGIDLASVWEAPVIRTYIVAGSIQLESPQRGIVFFPNGTSTGGRIIVTDEDGVRVSNFLVDPYTSELYFQ
ncbi:MAG: GspH/FimT family pseudopilin [Gemmatimonadales bacterium]|nr:GspH/FimT family pseudopilin [Gemmatimonadales bacterium]